MPLQDPDKGTQLHLGINHCGILTFQDSRKIQHFRWSEVQKINFEGKMFIVHVTISEVRACAEYSMRLFYCLECAARIALRRWSKFDRFAAVPITSVIIS